MTFPGKLSDEWVPVARIGGLNARMDAEMLQSYLESQNFTVRLFNDNTAGWMPMYAVFIPIRVCVPHEQADAARALLDEQSWDAPENEIHDNASHEHDSEAEHVEDAPACPDCGAKKLQHGQASLMFSVLSVFLLGIPLILRLSAWECRDCGWKGRSSDLF